MSIVERMARAIDPSCWRVLDDYLGALLKRYAGEKIGYDPNQFKHKKSMELARAALRAIRPEDVSDEMVEAFTGAWPDDCEIPEDDDVIRRALAAAIAAGAE